MRPPLLLVPGPVPLHPLVQEELAKPAVPHYGDAFVKAFREIQDLLHYAWAAPRARVFSVFGPGHAGLESILHTFLRPGDRAVVQANGFFGERTAEVLRAHGIRVDLVASAWGQGPDVAGVRAALRAPARVLAVVHNETSTGVTNPLEDMIELAHAAGAFVLIDAVSSFGGIPLPFEDLGIDAAFSASQKCLAAPAGFSPVAVGPTLWESSRSKDVHEWYFSLRTWDRFEQEWGDWHPMPTTVSSNLFYAYHRALRLVKEEGLEARIARHAKMAGRLREGLVALGFRLLASPDLRSNTVLCVAPPEDVDASDLVRRLREDHGIYISGGLGPLRGKAVRIGTMGTQAEPDVVDALLEAVRSLA